MVSYIARSRQWTISNLTKNTPTYDVKFAAPSVREIDLDFCTGTDGSMLECIVAHSDIMPPRDRIANNREHRRTFKELIQNSKQVTSSAIFRNGSSSLGQTILEVRHERKEAARVKREGEYKNNIQ